MAYGAQNKSSYIRDTSLQPFQTKAESIEFDLPVDDKGAADHPHGRRDRGADLRDPEPRQQVHDHQGDQGSDAGPLGGSPGSGGHARPHGRAWPFSSAPGAAVPSARRLYYHRTGDRRRASEETAVRVSCYVRIVSGGCRALAILALGVLLTAACRRLRPGHDQVPRDARPRRGVTVDLSGIGSESGRFHTYRSSSGKNWSISSSIARAPGCRTRCSTPAGPATAGRRATPSTATRSSVSSATCGSSWTRSRRAPAPASRSR